jgi:hypothetical protein
MRLTKITSAVSEMEDAAYERGVRDTLRAFNDCMKKLRKKKTKRHAKVKESETIIVYEAPAPRKRPPLRKNSEMARIFEAIKTGHGLRGSQAIEKANETGNPINVKTARTALRRLRVRGYTEKREGLWYPKGAS